MRAAVETNRRRSERDYADPLAQVSGFQVIEGPSKPKGSNIAYFGMTLQIIISEGTANIELRARPASDDQPVVHADWAIT